MTYEAPAIAPPAVLPWDTAAIIAAALAILRLDPADVDAARIADNAASAIESCEQDLDLAESPWPTSADIPPPVVEAAVDLTVERYRRKDAPGGITDSWAPDGASLLLPGDDMRGVRSKLAPYRGRWGLG